MNKKGMIFTRPRDSISFVVGLILAAYGIIPLLNAIGLLKFTLPAFLTGLPAEILIWVVAVGGAYVVVDGLIEPKMNALHPFLIGVGIILLAIGLIPILNKFHVIPFSLPFLGASLTPYQVLITIEGILLIIGGFTEH
ncbi:hypothetical protein HYU07_03995 [Candidatus Woesearchaeota archaeon]|nr:hypothetical protein [Candidatus Woesearchaeota archaeon]